MKEVPTKKLANTNIVWLRVLQLTYSNKRSSFNGLFPGLPWLASGLKMCSRNLVITRADCLHVTLDGTAVIVCLLVITYKHSNTWCQLKSRWIISLWLTIFLMDVDCRSEFGSVLLPKSAQDMLLNMSVGNGDMSIPSVYHYLPHLIGKPSALKPAIKLSKGRAGGQCIFFSLHLDSWSFFSFSEL